MTITINDNIKKLRTQKGNTQEELAGYLNITVQAVSKWERSEGYPDITLLPAISEFYNVTVDELLGVDAAKKEKRITELLEQAQQNDDIKEFDIKEFDEASALKRNDDKITRMREIYKEFPNDFRVMRYLMEALLSHAHQNHAELIALGKKILAECTDSAIRYEAIYFSCLSCVLINNSEQATVYANMLPSYIYTQERMLPFILKGQALLEHTQRYIVDRIEDVMNTVTWMLSAKEYAPEEAAEAWKTVAKLFEVLYNDGDRAYHGGYLLGVYMDITRLYAKIEDTENTVIYTALIIKQADAMAAAQVHQLDGALVNALKYDACDFGKGFDKERFMAFFDDPVFDFCRETEAFSKLLH